MNELCEWTHPRGVIQDGVATKRALQDAEGVTAGGGGRLSGGGGGGRIAFGGGGGNDNGGGETASTAGGGDVAPPDVGDSKVTVHAAPLTVEEAGAKLLVASELDSRIRPRFISGPGAGGPAAAGCRACQVSTVDPVKVPSEKPEICR